MPKFIPDEAIQVYLNACDVFLLPYNNITTSGAAALALSFGRSVIAPSIASFPEIVTPESGILYDALPPNALTLALQKPEPGLAPSLRILIMLINLIVTSWVLTWRHYKKDLQKNIQ